MDLTIDNGYFFSLKNNQNYLFVKRNTKGWKYHPDSGPELKIKRFQEQS